MIHYSTLWPQTYIVFSLEPKDGPGLVASDTLLDFEYIAVEIWTGTMEEMRKCVNFMQITKARQTIVASTAASFENFIIAFQAIICPLLWL